MLIGIGTSKDLIIKENKMGKICPRCNYHIDDDENYSNGKIYFECQHDYRLEAGNTISSNTLEKKWRCNKCLETKITYD